MRRTACNLHIIYMKLMEYVARDNDYDFEQHLPPPVFAEAFLPEAVTWITPGELGFLPVCPDLTRSWTRERKVSLTFVLSLALVS